MHFYATSHKALTWPAKFWSLSIFFMNLAYCCCSVGSILSGQPNLSKKYTSFSVEHAFVPSTYSDCINLMKRQLRNIVQFNEIGVTQNILFIFDVVLLCRIKSSTNGRCVPKRDWFTKLTTSLCVLIELCHFL